MSAEKENPSSWENFSPILNELKTEPIERLLGSFESVEVANTVLNIESKKEGRIAIDQLIKPRNDLIVIRLNRILEIRLKRCREGWGETFFMPDETKQRLKEKYPEFFLVTAPDLPNCLCRGLTLEDGVVRILEQIERWIIGSWSGLALAHPSWVVPKKFKFIEENVVRNNPLPFEDSKKPKS